MALNYQAAVNISAEFTGQRAVDQAKGSFASLNGTINGTASGISGLSSALKALAGAFIVREAVQFARSIINLGDKLDEMKQKTGIGVQTLAGLKAAAEDSGVQFDALEGSLAKFNLSISKAKTSAGDQRAAFKALGVDLGDIKKQTPDQLLLKVSDAFSSMKDGADKTRIAVELFGRSGAELIPTLNGLREGMKNALVIPDGFTERANVFNDTINQIKRNFTQFGINLVNGIFPALQEVAGAFAELTKRGGESKELFDRFSDIIRVIGLAAGIFSVAFSEGIDVVFTALKDLGAFLGEWLANRVDQFKTFGAKLKAYATLNFDEANRLSQEYEKRSAESSKRVSEQLDKNNAELIKRTEERRQKLATFINTLTKNLGNNAGAAADTAPAAGKPRTAAVDTTDLDDKYREGVKATEDRIRKIQAETKELGQSNAQRQIAVELAELENRGIKQGTRDYERLSEALKQVVKARQLANEKQSADDFLQRAKQEQELRTIEIDQINRSTEAQKKLVDAKRDEIALTQATKGYTKEGVAEYRKAQQEVARLREENDEREKANRESFVHGAKEAFQQYVNYARDASAQSKALFTGALNGLEDALVSFVKTGKLSFAQLADFIETELIRIAVRKTIAFALTSAGAAFATGGVMTDHGPMPLKRYAAGGIATSPQLAMFGEGRQPEAYVPLPDGRSIPVSMKGGSANGTSVVVNVSVAPSGESQKDTVSNTEKGKALGNIISAAITAQLIKEKLPGGLLA